MNSPISTQLAPLSHHPWKSKKSEKILQLHNTTLYGTGMHNAVIDVAKIKYLFIWNYY